MGRSRAQLEARRSARADPQVRGRHRVLAARVRLLGVLVCGVGLVMAAEAGVFRLKADRVDATVTSVESRTSGSRRSSRGLPEYRPSFTYTDAQGRTQQAVAKGWRDSWGWAVGRVVPVFVRVSDPSTVRPDTGWGYWSRPAYVSLIGVVIVGVTSLSLRTLAQQDKRQHGKQQQDKLRRGKQRQAKDETR